MSKAGFSSSLDRQPDDDCVGDKVLHRDVFWLGKQWAVTGYGIQAVSKRHNMKYDLDVSQIWKDDLDAPMRDLPWFDADDFAEAVKRARQRASESPASFAPPLSNER